MRAPSVWLALAALGCASAPVHHPAELVNERGRCLYTRGYWCEPGESCAPPAPAVADCPGSRARDADHWRPPSRTGWVRVRERLLVSRGVCAYYGDAYCPPPDHPTHAECDPPEFREVACVHTSTGARIAPFVVRRLSSSCVAYPALECALGECALPEGQPTSCR